jgi:hypothetical protein
MKAVSFGQRQVRLWFGLSLLIPVYFGGFTLLHQLYLPNIVQDDARQHIVFLQRWLDPQAFPQDLIADYFVSLAPAGYKALYWAAAQLGIAPLDLAKMLPLCLSLITSGYLFGICLQLLPLPLCGFLATLILNQQIWLNDDLVSATPRAFLYPIFTAFLYYLLKQSLIPFLITILLQGLFFPQLVLVQGLILTLRYFKNRASGVRAAAQTSFTFWVAGLLMAGLVLSPYASSISAFGPVITGAAMRTMPEYGLQGRNEYFGVNPLAFWLLGNSGLRIPVFPSLILTGLGLPWLKRTRLPLWEAVTAQVQILTQMGIASLIMYGLAHLLLLKLHFPSRYTYHTFRILLAIAAGIVLTVLLEAGWRWLQASRGSLRKKAIIALTTVVAITVLTVPAIPPLFVKFQGWVVGEAPDLYDYLAQQPQTALIASLSPEANNLPAFAKRSVLVGREFALPHHPEYYAQIVQRTASLIQAQYSPTLSPLIALLDQYPINFLLLDRNAFTPNYLQMQDWLIHSAVQKLTTEVTQRLQQGEQPAILQLIEPCEAASTDKLILLDAACIQRLSRSSPVP